MPNLSQAWRVSHERRHFDKRKARQYRGGPFMKGAVVATTSTDSVPEVLSNRYPVWDRAGNKLQEIVIRFGCGHVESHFSLDLGKGWKPRTKKQIANDELFITCPMGVKLCRECSKGAQS